MEQLTLDLGHRPAFGRDDFLVAPSNRGAVRLIDSWPDWPGPAAVLTGPAGSGKTHLAEVWHQASGACMIDGADLNVAGVPGLLKSGAVIIEDLPGAELAETALFHLINLAREQGGHVLLTSREYPAHWQVALPDLATRLKGASLSVLDEPDDALLRAVLVKLFADRQLAVDEGIPSYLVMRMERSLKAAGELVDNLDHMALTRQTRVTVKLAGDALREREARAKREAQGRLEI